MKNLALAALGQRLLPRMPVIVAVAFSVYSLVLLGYSVYSWRLMKHEADTYLLADSGRRAASLGDLVASLGEKARGHANLSEVHAYLLNRDLGMSLRYGLGASLTAIDYVFARQIREDASGTSARIVYLSGDGERLADTSPGEALPTVPLMSGKGLGMRVDARQGRLVVAVKVDHKGTEAGTVLTITPTRVLYRNLLNGKANDTRELLVTQEGEEIPSKGAGLLPPAFVKSLLDIPLGQVLQDGRLGPVPEDLTGMEQTLAVRTDVPGLPIFLVTLMSEKRAYGHMTPAGALVVAGLVPLLLLFGALRLERMRLDAERLRAEIRFAEQQRLTAEQRNLELATEIWRREMVEKALAESEERWELAIKGANDGIWDWNPTTGTVHFSDRWKTMLGYSPEEIPHHFGEWESRVHPDDLPRVQDLLQRHLNGDTEYYRAEYRMRHKDGHYVWILDRGQALFDAEGQPVRMAGSHTDETERHVAEERAQERTEQLNAIFDLSPDGFVSFGADGRVSYVNPAFLAMTNLDIGAALGLNEGEFSALIADLCPSEARFRGIHAMRTAPLPRGKREFIEVLGGGRRVLELFLRTGAGQRVKDILYFRDVTAETEVDQMKSEFLSTAAHELRTPMASIYGYAEVLMSFDFSEEERKNYLGLIFRQSQLMTSIINELLDLARIEARRGKDFQFERLNLADLVDESVGCFKPPGGRDSPAVEVPPQACWVRADRRKMQQSINNVLSNAYKYSPAGGAVEIELVAGQGAEGNQECGIRVRDHGIGLTAEESARVCERFYRVDASGKIPGTGLGMSIVKEIMDLHRGRIDIASQPGLGTTVTLWLQAFQET